MGHRKSSSITTLKLKEFENNFKKQTVYQIDKDDNVELIPALKEIGVIVFPTMFFFIGVYLQQTINLMFIGHTYDKDNRKDALDGVGISHLYINCSLLSWVVGIISGFETLGSNAYGAKRYYLFGVYLHRSILIAYSITFTLFIFHFIFAVKILSLLGIDENTLVFVSQYIRIMMFFTLFDVGYGINFRYFNIISKSHINLIILIISVVLHPMWCYLFMVIFKFGVQGAAFSLIISQATNCVAGLAYIYIYQPLPESIFFFNKDSFNGWWEYLKIALPSAFLICAEWLAYEITAFIAIWIGKIDYTVHIILSSINLNLFTFPFGFGTVACIILGHSICKKSINYVKKYALIIFVTGIAVIMIANLIIYINRDSLLHLYIHDDEIVTKAKEVIPIVCFYTLADMAQNTMAGMFRGLGKQLIATKIAMFNFYVTLYIFAIYFGKVLNWGVYGLWAGMIVGYGVNACCYFYLLYTFDFNAIQREVLARLESDTKMLTELIGEESDEEKGVDKYLDHPYRKDFEMREIVCDKYFESHPHINK
jgi:MATE family multidrug resistance protein